MVQPSELRLAVKDEGDEEHRPACGAAGSGGGRGQALLIFKILKQTCFFLLLVSLGLATQVVGPTLPDLKDMLKVNYEQISQALVAQSLGVLIGSLIGGYIHDRFPRSTDLFTAVSFSAVGLATILTPIGKTLPVVSAMFGVVGIAKGIIDTGSNLAVMRLWGDQTAVPMHSLHLGYGIGAVLAPQIVKPFLASTPSFPANDSQVTTRTWAMTYGPDGLTKQSRIASAYMIIGVTTIVCSLSLFGFAVKGQPAGLPLVEPVRFSRAMCSPSSCDKTRPTRGLVLLGALFLYFMQSVGGESAFGRFIFSFAVEERKWSKTRAASLNTVFWVSFTVGRLIGTLLASVVSTELMLAVDVLVSIVASIIMAVAAHKNDIVLWTFTALTGILISILFPSGMSWTNDKLTVNSIAIMVLLVGASCGGFAYQYATGYFFQMHGPRCLMYIMAVFAFLLAVICVALKIIARTLVKMPEKSSVNEDDTSSDNNYVSEL